MKQLILIFVMLILAAGQQSGQQPSRPTSPDDPMPPPDMDYFVGTWSFDWNVPESPLSPAGKIKGTETYRKGKGEGVYESLIVGSSPLGDFKGSAVTSYSQKERTVDRTDDVLFGTKVRLSGPIGGDLGGYYTIFWESAPIKKGGKTIILKGKTMMLSPASFRLQMRISVDGGPFTNYGNPWFTKVEAESKPE